MTDPKIKIQKNNFFSHNSILSSVENDNDSQKNSASIDLGSDRFAQFIDKAKDLYDKSYLISKTEIYKKIKELEKNYTFSTIIDFLRNNRKNEFVDTTEMNSMIKIMKSLRTIKEEYTKTRTINSLKSKKDSNKSLANLNLSRLSNHPQNSSQNGAAGKSNLSFLKETSNPNTNTNTNTNNLIHITNVNTNNNNPLINLNGTSGNLHTNSILYESPNSPLQMSPKTRKSPYNPSTRRNHHSLVNKSKTGRRGISAEKKDYNFTKLANSASTQVARQPTIQENRDHDSKFLIKNYSNNSAHVKSSNQNMYAHFLKEKNASKKNLKSSNTSKNALTAIINSNSAQRNSLINRSHDALGLNPSSNRINTNHLLPRNATTTTNPENTQQDQIPSNTKQAYLSNPPNPPNLPNIGMTPVNAINANILPNTNSNNSNTSNTLKNLAHLTGSQMSQTSHFSVSQRLSILANLNRERDRESPENERKSNKERDDSDYCNEENGGVFNKIRDSIHEIRKSISGAKESPPATAAVTVSAADAENLGARGNEEGGGSKERKGTDWLNKNGRGGRNANSQSKMKNKHFYQNRKESNASSSKNGQGQTSAVKSPPLIAINASRKEREMNFFDRLSTFNKKGINAVKSLHYNHNDRDNQP